MTTRAITTYAIPICMGHNYIGTHYVGNNYIGHGYIGNNYIVPGHIDKTIPI